MWSATAASIWMEKEEKGREWNLTLRDIKKTLRELDANKPKLSANKSRLESCMTDDSRDSYFYGTSWENSLSQVFNGLEDFAAWKKRAEREIKINTLRRRRIKISSDTEGDILDMDKLRYSDYPFTYPKKKHVTSPIIKINVSAAFSCGNSSDAITTYGLRVYEIVNTLEAQGKTVELSVYYNISGLYNEDYKDRKDGKEDFKDFWKEDIYSHRYATYYVKVKEAGEYIEPSRVAVTLTSFFFRRVMFAMYAIYGDKENLSCSSGLGYPKNKWRSGRYNEDIFKLTEDTLWIEPNDAHQFSEEMVAKGIALASAIGITNETEMLEEQTGWR